MYTVKKFGGEETTKARLVARGFQDFCRYKDTETYSPVIHTTTFRWLMLMVNRFDLELMQLDVKTAFLYRDIEWDDVFIEVPDGLSHDHSQVALQLQKSLYGLKTSRKIWFERLRREILQYWFHESVVDQCIFYCLNG